MTKLPKKIPIISGGIQPSPFVIKLTRHNGVREDLSWLAKELLFEPSEAGTADEAPLMELIGTDPLALSISEVEEQLELAPGTLSAQDLSLINKTVGKNVGRQLAVALDILENVDPVIACNWLEINDDQINPSSSDSLINAPSPAAFARRTSPSVAFADLVPPSVTFVHLVPPSEATPSDQVITANNLARLINSQAINFNRLRPSELRFRLAGFAALLLLSILPLQAFQAVADFNLSLSAEEARSEAAIMAFQGAGAALGGGNIAEAGAQFATATTALTAIESSFSQIELGIGKIIAHLPAVGETIKIKQNLLQAATALAGAGVLSTEMLEALDRPLPLPERLQIASVYLNRLSPLIASATTDLSTLTNLIDQYPALAPMTDFLPVLTALNPLLLEYPEHLAFLGEALGAIETKRYLLAFQNNTELRATGGFMGSLAEIDVSNGKIIAARIPGGGPYDFQGQLTEFVSAPKPIQLINARWELQDANWFPDFPTSARKIEWFYTHSGGPSLDGVIAVNASWVASLIEFLGPISLPEYGVELTPDNFFLTLQTLVEKDYDHTANNPKAVIGKIFTKLLDRSEKLTSTELLQFLSSLTTALQTRDLQLYLNDDLAQSKLTAWGLDGALKQPKGDYLMVVNTNIGGGKTDGVIGEAINLEVVQSKSGAWEHHLTFTRTHHGIKNELFRGVNNVDYVRFYVPDGSTLISASDTEPPAPELFESYPVPLALDSDLALNLQNLKTNQAGGMDVWRESGKTIFGGWVQTKPGEVSLVSLVYKIPPALAPIQTALSPHAWLTGESPHYQYSHYYQEQSGVLSRTYHSQVSPLHGLIPVWTNQDAYRSGEVTSAEPGDLFAAWIW